jgi:hypothetical protein
MNGRQVILFACASLTACGGSHSGVNTGNGMGAASLAMGVTAPEAGALTASPAGLDAQGTAFTVETARASVRQVRMTFADGAPCTAAQAAAVRAPARCDSDRMLLDGPLVFDLVARTSDPNVASVPVPAVGYSRIEVRFDVADPQDGLVAASDPLAQNTLEVTGSFAYHGANTPYRFALAFNEDAIFPGATPVSVADGAETPFLMYLDVQKWFQALPLTQCLDAGDLAIVGGALTLSNQTGSCSAIEGALKSAIEESGKLLRD